LAVCLAVLAVLPGVLAQDPANGWLGYATGLYTANRNAPITFIEAYWKCGSNPPKSNAFFSPWFGLDTTDNLNLIQPVNPWTGSQWEIYNEYYQWQPTHNENSASHVVAAGDVLYGSITFNEADESYMLYHKDMTSGWSVNMSVPVQKSGTTYKNYTIIYFVYEKVAQCSQYPPDGQVTFYNIHVEVGGKDVTSQIAWTTAYVEDVCDFRAHVLNSTSIQITWNTKLDNGREQEPIKALNEDKISARREQAGMAYREEPPRRKPGMRYREASAQAASSETVPSQTAGMAYREQAEVGMRYREDPPQRAGMAYREDPPQRRAGMAYREV
jgi:hypothetical protein